MSNTSESQLSELLNLAETPEDVEYVLGLIAEEKKRRANRDKWDVATLSDVAEFFGLSVQTVKQWRQESPPMPGSEGSWPLPAIVKWRMARLTQSEIGNEQKRVALELSRIEVEKKRLELDREKGELVYLDDVELWASVAMVETREMLMQLSQLIASSAPPEVKEFARAEADRRVREVLTMLARRLDTHGIETEGSQAA